MSETFQANWITDLTDPNYPSIPRTMVKANVVVLCPANFTDTVHGNVLLRGRPAEIPTQESVNILRSHFGPTHFVECIPFAINTEAVYADQSARILLASKHILSVVHVPTVNFTTVTVDTGAYINDGGAIFGRAVISNTPDEILAQVGRNSFWHFTTNGGIQDVYVRKGAIVDVRSTVDGPPFVEIAIYTHYSTMPVDQTIDQIVSLIENDRD